MGPILITAVAAIAVLVVGIAVVTSHGSGGPETGPVRTVQRRRELAARDRTY